VRKAKIERPEGARVRAGGLGSTSLAQLLFELLDAEDSGSLLIWNAQDALEVALRFERGYPVSALADVDDEHNVATLLLPVFGWEEGRFEFVADDDLVGEHAVVRGRVDPLPLIAAASRACLKASWIERSMTVIERGLIRRSRRLDPARYAFTSQELLVLVALDADGLELEELRERAQVAEPVLQRVLHVLWVTRGISLLPRQRMVSGAAPRSLPPRKG
jgi:hypothetical protein